MPEVGRGERAGHQGGGSPCAAEQPEKETGGGGRPGPLWEWITQSVTQLRTPPAHKQTGQWPLGFLVTIGVARSGQQQLH